MTKRFSQLLLGGNHLQLHFARLHVLPRRSDLLLRGRERKPEQLTHPGGILLVNSSGRDSVRPEVRPGPERVRPRAGCASTPLPRTNRTSLVPPLVLSGHAASLTPYVRGVCLVDCCGTDLQALPAALELVEISLPCPATRVSAGTSPRHVSQTALASHISRRFAASACPNQRRAHAREGTDLGRDARPLGTGQGRYVRPICTAGGGGGGGPPTPGGGGGTGG